MLKNVVLQTDSVDKELKKFKDAVLQEGDEEGKLVREFGIPYVFSCVSLTLEAGALP